MLTAQIAAIKTELKARVSKASTIESEQEATTDAEAKIATSPNPESAKTESTKNVKAELNKVSFIVYMTRSPAQFHFSFHIGTLHHLLSSDHNKTPTKPLPDKPTVTQAIWPHRHRHQHPASSPRASTSLRQDPRSTSTSDTTATTSGTSTASSSAPIQTHRAL